MTHRTIYLGCALTLLSALAPAQRSLATSLGDRFNDRFGGAMRGAGDVDRDAFPDWIASSHNQQNVTPRPLDYVKVVSGRTGQVIHVVQAAAPSAVFGFAVSGAGDLNADGWPDFVIGTPARPGLVQAFSGKDRSPLFSVVGEFVEARMGTDVCELGDVNGDGHADFVAAAPVYGPSASAPERVHVISGKTGTSLFSVNMGIGVYDASDPIGKVRPAGDLNLDGTPDFLVSDPRRAIVRVFSGKNGAILFQAQHASTNVEFADDAAAIGDLDADGVTEIAVSAPSVDEPSTGRRGVVFVYSGKTALLQRTFRGPILELPAARTFGTCLVAAGDVDADGLFDLAVGESSVATSPPRVTLISTRTGLALAYFESPATAGSFGSALEPLGDLDHDGMRDLLLADLDRTVTLGSQGAVDVISTRVLAIATNVGNSCGAGPLLPTLRCSRPLVGQTMTVLGQDAQLGVPGFLLWSLAPASSYYLGVPGCSLEVSPSDFLILHTVNGSQSSWTTTLPIPPYQQFSGMELAMQAIYGPTTGPIGADLTNGVRLRIGY